MAWNAKNMAAALPAGNMAAALPAGNMAAAIPAGNMAAAIPGANMAAAIPAGNMAAAIPAGNMAAAIPVVVGTALPPPRTGAGTPSGHGFLGGYGDIARSDYATPADLGPIAWAQDFTYGTGWPPFPIEQWLNPADLDPVPHWQVGEWDPALRFWTLPFDATLTEWLQDLNLAAPSVMVAREFARHHDLWSALRPEDDADHPGLRPGAADAAQGDYTGLTAPSKIRHVLYENDLLAWYLPERPDDPARPGQRYRPTRDAAGLAIRTDITNLQDMMRDERARYLEEAGQQSANIAPFYLHLLGMDTAGKPWTLELMNCAAAISNLVKMHYKSVFRRPRPSTLCPGLVPPWGPPQHPAFPSGHALVAHMMALTLLRIPYLASRFGGFGAPPVHRPAGLPALSDFVGESPQVRLYGQDMRSPLLWLAWRMARNRERIALHYPTDSAASRALAAALCAALFEPDAEGRSYTTMHVPANGDARRVLPRIALPTLQTVLRKAIAEWPEPPAAWVPPGPGDAAAAGAG